MSIINKNQLETCIISTIFLLTIFFSGCVYLETESSADIQLTGFNHNERKNPFGFVSEVSFIVENFGNKTVSDEDINIKLEVMDQDGNQVETRGLFSIESLSPRENTTINDLIYYEQNDTSLQYEFFIEWNGKHRRYTDNYSLENISSNVILTNITHNEGINLDEILYSNVNFTLKNIGELDAEDIYLELIATDQNQNVIYDGEVSVAGFLGQNETITEQISIDYNFNDQTIYLNISVKWHNGKNQYSDEIIPEITY